MCYPRGTSFLNECCHYSDCSVSVLLMLDSCWFCRNGCVGLWILKKPNCCCAISTEHLLTVILSTFSEKCSFHLCHDPQGIYLNQKGPASIVLNCTAYWKPQTKKKAGFVVYAASAYFPPLVYPLEIYSVRSKWLLSLFLELPILQPYVFLVSISALQVSATSSFKPFNKLT